MKGKWAYALLLACLGAFGYLFAMNPTQVSFRLFPGGPVRTNLALVLFLAFLAGFGVAFVTGLAREAVLSLGFWRRQRSEASREEGRRLFARARGHVVEGKVREAGRMLKKAYRRLPGDPGVALELARAELAQGRGGDAERRLKALLEDDARNPEALALLLQVYRGRGDFEGQVATLARCLEADPDHRASLQALRNLYRGTENWKEAVRVQERLLACTEGREARARERRVLSELLLLATQGVDPARAAEDIRRVLEEDGEFAAAHGALGDALAAQGDIEGAARAWLKGYERTGQAGLLLGAEKLRVSQGRGEEMLKFYRRLGKRDAAAVLLRARLLVALDRADEALDLLEASEAGAGSASGRWLMGEALFRLRSYERAARQFRESFGDQGEGPRLEFHCGTCGRSRVGWAWLCDGCGAVGTFTMSAGG